VQANNELLPGPERNKESGKAPQRGGHVQLPIFQRTQAARIIKFTFVLMTRNEIPAPAYVHWAAHDGRASMEGLYLGIAVTSLNALVAMALIIAFF
jgi:hypothetical protein